MTRSRLLILVCLAFSAWGCADKEAPPAPFLEPVSSPTAEETATLSGTAEHGTTVKVTGGAADVEVVADPISARFRTAVTLKPNETNVLSVTATDEEGNTSEPTLVEVVHQTGYGELSEVVLALFRNEETTPLADPVQISAGDRLRTEARALDGAGNALSTPVVISTNIPNALIEGVTLRDLSSAGSFRVVATAVGSTLFAARDVQIQPGPATRVSIQSSRDEAIAGTLVPFTARALDAFGNEVIDAALTLTASPPLASTFTVPGSNPPVELPQGIIEGAQQFVAYDLSGVAGADSTFTLKATLNGTALEGVTKLRVRPAAGVRFSQLEFTDGTTAATVQAGTDVEYRYAVVDLYGNPVATPVSAFTSAPGAVIIDDGITGSGRITGLTARGDSPVTFYIQGAGQKGNLQISVGNGPASFLDLGASTTLASPDSDVKVFAQVRDAYGNVIGCTSAAAADVQFTATGQSTGVVPPQSTACFNSAFEAVYRFTSEDNIAITATYAPGGTPTSATDSVFVTVLSFDNAPPSVALKNVLHDGVPCPSAPQICNVRPGEFIQFVVEASDNKSLSEIAYTAFFSTAGATGTLRSRNVLVPNDATLPLQQAFSFNVPNAFIEDVPLTALAIDGSGNRYTTPDYLLRVSLQTWGDRQVTLVARDTGGNVLNSPEDVVVSAAGEVFIANRGNDDVLRLPAGATFPLVHTSAGALAGLSPGFITLDSAGSLFVSDSAGSRRVKRIQGSTVADYIEYGNGANLRGLQTLGSTLAKGIAVVNGVQDGDELAIAATTYELDDDGLCTAGRVCVPFSGSNLDVANALAACIGTGAGCTVNGVAAAAHADVVASVSATPNAAVIISAKVAGSAGALSFTTNACPRLLLNNPTFCPGFSTTLLNGFDESLLVGQEAAGDDIVFRFLTNATTLLDETSSLPSFDMTTGGVRHEQWGLAARDLTTPSGRALRDLSFYFPDASAGQNRLQGVRVVDASSQSIFNSASVNGARPGCANCIRGTNDPLTPMKTFSFLWDTAVEPGTGCLLVSDLGNGDIYVVDTRNPATADPLVSVVASGLPRAAGLGFGPDGKLYVAVSDADAVIAFSPSPSTTDCF